MFRNALWFAGTAALVGAVLFGMAGPAPAAPPPGAGHAGFSGGFHTSPPPFPFTAPSVHFNSPPSSRPTFQAPSYYDRHYYNGVFPHADFYSYYDPVSPYNPSRKPTYGTVQDLGGGTPYLGPLYPDEYSSTYPGGVVPDTGTGRGPAEAIGRVTVKVPADAEVRFDGYKTTTSGPVRRFETPLLKPGRPYNYEIEARWKEEGREVTQKTAIAVAAGGSTEVHFPLPAGDRGKGGNAKEK